MAFHKYKLIEIIHKEAQEDISHVINVTGRLEIIVVYHRLQQEISFLRTSQQYFSGPGPKTAMPLRLRILQNLILDHELQHFSCLTSSECVKLYVYKI